MGEAENWDGEFTHVQQVEGGTVGGIDRVAC